jgi:hypothetical protein
LGVGEGRGRGKDRSGDPNREMTDRPAEQ